MHTVTGPKWLSDTELARRYGVSRISIWRWSKSRPGFPKPRKLAANTTRWLASEIEAYDEKLIADSDAAA